MGTVDAGATVGASPTLRYLAKKLSQNIFREQQGPESFGASVPEQDIIQCNEAEIIDGFLRITDQNRPAFAQPTAGTFHLPATRLASLATGWVELFFPDSAYVRNVPGFLHRLLASGIVISFIQTQMLWHFFRIGTTHHNRIDRG